MTEPVDKIKKKPSQAKVSLSRKLVTHAKKWLAVTIISTAALILIFRLSLPFAGDFRGDISNWISDSVSTPIEFSGIELKLNGYDLQLRIEKLQLYSYSGDDMLHMGSVSFSLNIIDTIIAQQPITDELYIHDLQLTLRHKLDGSFVVAGQREGGSAFMGWILSQPSLKLHNSNIVIVDDLTRQRWQLADANLIGYNNQHKHQISGEVTVINHNNKVANSNLFLAIDWYGDIWRPQEWDGELYLQGQGIDSKIVPVPFISKTDNNNMEFAVWANLTAGSLNKVEGWIKDLNLNMGVAGKQTQFSLKQSSFNWYKQEDGWIVNTDDMVLRQNGQLLPTKQLKFIKQKENQQTKNKRAVNNITIAVDQLSVNAVSDLFGRYQVISEKLKPVGMLQYPVLNVTDGEWSVATRFNKLGLAFTEQLPTISEASGKMRISSNRADVSLNSSTINYQTLPKIEASGDVAIQINSVGINWSSSNLALATQHATSKGIVKGIIPWSAQKKAEVTASTVFEISDILSMAHYLENIALPAGLTSSLTTAKIPQTKATGVLSIQVDSKGIQLTSKKLALTSKHLKSKWDLQGAIPWGEKDKPKITASTSFEIYDIFSIKDYLTPAILPSEINSSLLAGNIPKTKAKGELSIKLENNAVKLDSQHLSLTSNHLSSKWKIKTEIPQAGQQQAKVLANATFKVPDVSKVKYYLSKELLPVELSDWLKSSLIAGSVPKGKLSITAIDKFSVNLLASDVTLQYDQYRQPLTDLYAVVKFNQDSLKITNGIAALKGVKVKNLTAKAKNLDKEIMPPLKVNGEFSGKVANISRALQSDGIFTQISGDSTLLLSISIPLTESTADNSKEIDLEILGKLLLDNNKIVIADQLKINDLSQSLFHVLLPMV